MSQSKPTSWPHLNGDFWHCEFRNWFSTNPEALKNTIFTKIQTLLKYTSTICEPQSSHIQTLLKSTSTICEPQSSQRYKPCWNIRLQYVNHNLHRDTNLAEIYVYNMWTTIFTEIQTLLKSTSTICEPQSSQRYKPCWNLHLQYVNHNLHRDTNLAEIYVYNMWTTIFTNVFWHSYFIGIVKKVNHNITSENKKTNMRDYPTLHLVLLLLSTFHCHSRVFNNKHNSYPKMSVKLP